MPSVIIPACNEERVIGRCLTRLLEDSVPGEFEVIVVCNGCTDATAQIARAAAAGVRVVETPIASKNQALNVGDALASNFPRLYLDADIELRTSALRATVTTLEEGALAAAPSIHVELAGVSWPVAAYFRVWLRLQYASTPLCGSGVYGLSELGRDRFGAFPEHVADDAWVRYRFAPDERRAVPGAQFVYRPPRSLRSLVDVQTRAAVGAHAARRGAPWPREPYGWRALAEASPVRAVEAAVYVLIRAFVRLRALRRLARGDIERWDRDDTSRLR